MAPKVHHPAEMDLGDMFISLAYVNRQMDRDRAQAAGSGAVGGEGGVSQGEDEDVDDDKEEEGGVSGAMAHVFCLQVRGTFHDFLREGTVDVGDVPRRPRDAPAILPR